MVIDGYTSVIVLTRDLTSSNAQRCFRALAESTAEHELIVVQRHKDWQTGTTVAQGLAGAVGQYIAIVCDDCFVEPMTLELMRERLFDPRAGVVGGLLYNANKEIGFYGSIARQVEGEWKFARWGQLMREEEIDFLTGALIMTRRDIIDEIGGWDERFKLCFGDADFCFRVRQAGYDICLATEAKAMHLEASTRRQLGLMHDPEGMRLFKEKWSKVYA